MAVSLDFSYLQSNDRKTIEITDTTGEYDAVSNTGGWGTPNPDPSTDVVAATATTVAKYHVLLDITYTDSGGTETTYDTIDLYSEFTSEFAAGYGMVYTLTMAHFEESGVAVGTADDEFPDGIYDITYSITNATDDSEVDSELENILIVGAVRDLMNTEILEGYTNIYRYKDFNADNKDYQALLDSIFLYSYFNALITNNDNSYRTQKLEMLYFLEQRLN